MMNEIRQFNTERESLEDLISMHAFGTLVLSEFESFDVDAPDWLTPKVKAIKRQIQATVRDRLAKRLEDQQLKLESLKTSAERKTEINKEIARLKAALKED